MYIIAIRQNKIPYEIKVKINVSFPFKSFLLIINTIEVV